MPYDDKSKLRSHLKRTALAKIFREVARLGEEPPRSRRQTKRKPVALWFVCVANKVSPTELNI